MYPPFDDRKAFILAGSYLSYFAILSLQLTYLPTYILTKLHFRGTQLSIIYAGVTVIAMMSIPLWGQLADYTKKTGKIIRCCILAGLLSFLPTLVHRDFISIIICLWMMAFFNNTIPALLDSIVLTRFGVRNYGKIRVWGSIGYGCSALAFSKFPVDFVLYAILVCLFLCFCIVQFIGEESRPKSSEKSVSLFILLGNRHFVILVLFGILHWCSNIPYHMILNLHRESLSLPAIITGYAVALAVVSECTIISISGKWLSRGSPRNWLLLAASITVARWLIMTYPLSGVEIVAVQFLHGFSFGVFFIASVSHLTSIVPEHMRASGQSLFTALVFCPANIIGSIYIGVVYDLPIPLLEKGYCTFKIAALFSLASLIMALFIVCPKQKEESTT